MITIVEGDFTLPDRRPSLSTLYGSKSADEKGNNNFRGVKSRRSTICSRLMAEARTLDELRDAARALDRVVMWSHWQVPDLYASDEKSSYWNKFGMPARRPKYFTIESALSAFPAWPLGTWWMIDPGKPQAVACDCRIMLIYILKRLALMMPTLLGALTITFIVIQFVPGGPVEQMMAEARAGQRRRRQRLQGRPRQRREADRGAEEAVRLRQAGARALRRDARQLRCASTSAAASCRTRTSGS